MICEKDPIHDVDDYGCVDCFYEAITVQSLIEMDKDEQRTT